MDKTTGKPGAELFEDLDIPAQHARIFNFEDKWEDHVPSLGALEEARRKGEEKAAA